MTEVTRPVPLNETMLTKAKMVICSGMLLLFGFVYSFMLIKEELTKKELTSRLFICCACVISISPLFLSQNCLFPIKIMLWTFFFSLPFPGDYF